MKTSYLFVLLFANLFLCCRKNVSTNKQAISAARISITLNGIKRDDAAEMLQHFNNLKPGDLHPIKTNIWFDSSAVHRMLNLLNKEGSDGVRIYFASALTEYSMPLKNTVILVSTRRNKSDLSVPSYSTHIDYYDHSATDPLFQNLNKINGVATYGYQAAEDLLYKTCGTSGQNGPVNETNIHQLSRQTAEAMVQNFGSGPVTTISEWFDLNLFKMIVKDKRYDGIRIYFASRQNSPKIAGDCFVLIKTIPGTVPGTHVDYFGTPIPASNIEIADGGQDNGEICPTHCP